MSSSELFRTLNTGLGVVGGQRTFDSRPAVLSPLYSVMNGASTRNIV